MKKRPSIRTNRPAARLPETQRRKPTEGHYLEARRWRDQLTNTDRIEFVFSKAGGGEGSTMLEFADVESRKKIRQALRNSGADIPFVNERADAIIGKALEEMPTSIGILAYRSGWHGSRFLFGDFLYGEGGPDIRLRRECVQLLPKRLGRPGTLRRWQMAVAEPISGSTFGSFAVLVALSAPVSRHAAVDEGAIFNFFGPSGSGKTTILSASTSILSGSTILGDWNLSDRALQEFAAAFSDLPMVLDDLERFRPGPGGRATSLSMRLHVLTSGRGTGYSQTVRPTLPALEWWAWALSSSPHSLQTEFAVSRRIPTGGDFSRWIDIEVPPPDTGGIWDRAELQTSATSAAGRSEAIKAASRVGYGSVMRIWARRLAQIHGDLPRKVAAAIDEFVEGMNPSASDVERRIARKIGTVYAAGLLAIEFGILPWTQDFVRAVCRDILQNNQSLRGSRAAAILDAKARLLAAVTDPLRLPRFAANATPHFQSLSRCEGFCQPVKGRDLLFIRGSLLDEMLGEDLDTIVTDSSASGAALPGHGSKATRQERIFVGRKAAKLRFYCFDAERLIEALQPPAH